MRTIIWVAIIIFSLGQANAADPKKGTAVRANSWMAWIKGTQELAELKERGFPILTAMSDSACSREAEGPAKNACVDFYNGILERRRDEKRRLERMAERAQTLPWEERDRVIPEENAEHNRMNNETDALYAVVVKVYPPLKQASPTR